MLNKIRNTIFFIIVTLIILFLMDLSGLNSQGTNNIFGSLDNLGITFINFYSDITYNIFASLIIIISVLYMLFTILLGNKKNKTHR